MSPLSLRELQTQPGIGLCRRDDHPATQRPTFMIATGLECSYPTVQGGKRRDELESTGHYEHWREDFDLCVEIGARHVRYGLPYYKTHLGPGRYDWSFPDEVLPVMWNKGLIPIADLCHFGVPDWVESFCNPDWPSHFAEYCSAFAERYPWIRFYTPVNEMLVCARFSGKTGGWNDQAESDEAMVSIHANECRASLLAMAKILRRRPDAVFVQSEVAEAYVELGPGGRDVARFHNQFRFITFDHLTGRPPSGEVRRFLLENGQSEDDLKWFLEHGEAVKDHLVVGMDYYGANEKVVTEEGEIKSQGQMLGWHTIARDYYDRYRRPLMMTETNALDKGDGESASWLTQTWTQAHHLRTHGIPVVGYTWFSLTDQIDWNIQIVRIEDEVTPNGLCRLDRTLRDVGRLYKSLANQNAGSELVKNVPNGLLKSPQA